MLYLEHKKNVLEIFESIQKMDPSNPYDIKLIKDSLEKNYPKENKNILDLDGKQRINNMPLNLNDDLMFFLILKIKLGDNLYKCIL